MTLDHPTLSLIVAERGSAWASWAERYRSVGPDVVVVLQEKGETAPEFAARVRARIAEMELSGRCPERAVLVGGGRADRDAVTARSLAVRSIASAMARHGGGKLTLDSAHPDRFAMAAIAATVSDLIRGTGVRVAPANDQDFRQVA
jgi:broad specificity phosphatase PhoE